MFRKSFLVKSVCVLCVLLAVMMLVGGCLSTPTPISPTATSVSIPTIPQPRASTPVPISTWVVQQIPKDTVISYASEQVSSREFGVEITITADGTVIAESWGGNRADAEWRKGQISQNELKQLLFKLEQIDFFALTSDGMCVYSLARSPVSIEHPIAGTTYMDYSKMQVLVTINGMTQSISTMRRGGTPQACLYDSAVTGSLNQFTEMLLAIGRQVPKMPPTPEAEGFFKRGRDNAAINPDRAIADLTQAITLKADYAESYLYRGRAYAAKSDYERALADYDQAIKFKPDFADAFYSRGLLFQHKGEKAKAIADFKKYIELGNNPTVIESARMAINELEKQ